MVEDDFDLADIKEVAVETDQRDVAVAMEMVNDAVEDEWPDGDVDAAVDAIELPFHSLDRELAFSLGLMFGAWLEKEYPDDPGGSSTSSCECESSQERTSDEELESDETPVEVVDEHTTGPLEANATQLQSQSVEIDQ